jgi:hypothetical protein
VVHRRSGDIGRLEEGEAAADTWSVPVITTSSTSDPYRTFRTGPQSLAAACASGPSELNDKLRETLFDEPCAFGGHWSACFGGIGGRDGYAVGP